MLIIICGNGDVDSASYSQAEQTFVRRLLDHKASSIPRDAEIKTFSSPEANLPDVNNQMTTQMFLTVLLKRMSIDPIEAELSWEAELFKESGYAFVTFFCTAGNPSYSFEVTEKPKAFKADTEGLKPIIPEVLRQAKAKLLYGQALTLTPATVTEIDDRGLGKPGVLVPRYEFLFSPENRATELHKLDWIWEEQDTHETENWSAGIYQGDLEFGKHCICCLKVATQYEVIQFSIEKNIIAGIQFPDANQEEVDRIFDAWFYDRYWYALPFCNDHDLKSKAISCEGTTFNSIRFGFVNQEYGKFFGKANRIKGLWYTRKQRFLRRILGPILGSICGFSIFFGTLILIRGCRGKLGNAIATPTDIPSGITVVIGGLVFLILLLVYMFKHGEGEDLNE